MNLCSEHQLPRLEFKHHTRSLQASLIDMSDATFLEIFASLGHFILWTANNIMEMSY